MKVPLRPIELGDAAAVQQYAADPRIAATTGMPHPYPANGGEEFVKDRTQARAAGTCYAMAILVDGEFAGVMGLNEINRDNRSARLDYFVAVPFWGRGIATAAAEQALAVAFNELQLGMVYSGCLQSNAQSGRVLEKAGFQEREPTILRTANLKVRRFNGSRCQSKSGSQAVHNPGEPVVVRCMARWHSSGQNRGVRGELRVCSNSSEFSLQSAQERIGAPGVSIGSRPLQDDGEWKCADFISVPALLHHLH